MQHLDKNSNFTSQLMAIQPTIIRFTNMLASVLKIDAEVVDSDLVRIAGTGPYNHSFGKKLNHSAKLFRYILETKEQKTIIRTQDDSFCGKCENSHKCTETAFLGVPIISNEQCIGVISLVAFNDEAQQNIQQNSATFSDYIKHVAQLVVANLAEKDRPEHGLEEVFLNLIDNMDQGVLVLDENDYVKYGNQPALNHLSLKKSDLSKIKINIKPLAHHKNNIDGEQQHIISLGARDELLIGRFNRSQSHKLFLMSFYQPHSSGVKIEPNAVFADMIGESEKMLHIKSLIGRVASSPSSVLINGESGTGKEVIANAIHKLSNRSKNPFIAINCAAIPDQLLESELFGYVKGAFTGASNQGRVGLIEAANHGTLFLDEIGDMTLQLQAKLLRVLETREVVPIGSNKAIPVDIRIISATNRNFEALIANNEFREDLYYRLNVIPLYLPPLKERAGDVALLVNYFMSHHSQKIGVSYPGITQEAMDNLTQYHWPGNVRELSNLVEYLINILPEGGKIDTDLLPPHIQMLQAQRPSAPSLVQDHANMSLESMEKQKIEEAINRLGNRKLVAQELGIGIATLYRKIKKYEIKN